MDHVERIFYLHRLLSDARYPIPRRKLEEKLECSEKTARRALEFLRDRLGAPLEYDQALNGWYYHSDKQAIYQLPGMWLTDKEIHALLSIQQLAGCLDPDLLQGDLAFFEKRVIRIIEKTTGMTSAGSLADYIYLMPFNRRVRQHSHFQTIACACLQRRQLKVMYHARSSDAHTEKWLSPQKLIYYRDNWYLAAYCHVDQHLHPYSLDRLGDPELLSEAAEVLGETYLSQWLFSSFGIFAGEVSGIAELSFSTEAARWVEEVIWHPDQVARWDAQGSYVLSVPFNNPTELIGEILRFGERVEVISPVSLREAVKEKLRLALDKY